MAAVTKGLVHQLNVVLFSVSGPLGLHDPQPFESRVWLKPGLGGVIDVASAIISHEQTH